MADIWKVQAVWSGFLGGPGVNTFYVNELPTSLTSFRDFYDDLILAIPAGVSVQVQNAGVSVDDVTGILTGSYSVAAQAVVNGTGEGQHVAGSGSVCRWITNEIVNGRRVYGHSYIVPLTRGNFGTNGQLTSGYISAAEAACGALAASQPMVVWHRPVNEAGGSSHTIENGAVPAKPAQLRSRRD